MAWQMQASASPMLVVYKTPTCGCCGLWVDHMVGAGFEAETHNMDNLSDLKAHYGIRPEYASCHTTIVDGYVIEGHVPAEFVERLLEERPTDIAGLTVPGMPIGSPGMEQGDRYDAYDVLAFTKSGETRVYAHVPGR